jgi:Na+/melibiose symporter-like transporter
MIEQGGSFQLTQGLEVLKPRTDQAYPIPCEEWASLKTKLLQISSEPWFFHTIGALLLGAAVTTLIAILLGSYSAKGQERALVIAYAVFAVTGIAGSLCLLFAHKERQVQRDRASDIVAQMELIEKRYERVC